MTGKVHSLSYFSLIGENDKLYCIFFSVFGFCWFYSCFYEMVVGHIIVCLICVLFVHPHIGLYWRRFPLTSCVLNELPVTTNYNHTTGEFSIIPLTDYQINLDWGRFKKKNHQNVEGVIDMIHGRSLKGPRVGTCNILQTYVVVQVTQMLFIPQIIRLSRCVFAYRISMTFSMGCDRWICMFWTRVFSKWTNLIC